MLIALIFAVASIQAQSARRPVAQQKKERERTAQKAESTKPARKVHSTQARSQQSRSVQAARKVQTKEPVRREHMRRYPHQFSGGQRQRIAIARVLAVKPEIIILDEPVSSLDVVIQSEILKLLKELQKELFLTYVFISHDLRVVEYMADDIAVMYKGEIVEFATRDEIYTLSKHPYTKKLLSSIPRL